MLVFLLKKKLSLKNSNYYHPRHQICATFGPLPPSYAARFRTVYVLCVDAIQQIFREEGFRGLWSGTRASLVLAANPAIQFTVYETVKRYMRGANKEV